jgi:hypothetical protein
MAKCQHGKFGSGLIKVLAPKIEPHLPTDARGKARVDDRWVISGNVHVVKSGGRRGGRRTVRMWAEEDALRPLAGC